MFALRSACAAGGGRITPAMHRLKLRGEERMIGEEARVGLDTSVNTDCDDVGLRFNTWEERQGW